MDYDVVNLIEHFLWAMQCQKHHTINTCNSYKYDFNVFKNFINETNISIENEGLLFKYNEYLKEKKNKIATITRKLNLIIKFLEFCNEEKEMQIIIPEKKRLKINKQYRTFLENKDLMKMRDFLKEPTEKNIRLLFIIETLYATGMRVSELLNLKVEDLFYILKDKSLVIIGKGGVQRMIFFNENCIDCIKKYKQICKPKYKLLNITRQRVFQLLKELSVKLSIDMDKVFPHSFRHRLLTNLVKEGLDLVTVQKIAGHKQISTTEKYTHVEDYLYEEILKYHPFSLF